MAYISSSRRTRMTFESIADFAKEVSFTDSIYESEVENLIHLVENVSNIYHKVLILGHNPGLELLLENLIGYSVISKFPTSGIANIRWNGDWKDFKKKKPKMVFFWIPYPEKTEELVAKI